MNGEPAPLWSPPTQEELQSRLDKVRSLMARAELDCYVVAVTDNIYYLTNFSYTPWERPFFLLIPAHRRPYLLVPLLELDHARDRVMLDLDFRTYAEYPALPEDGYAAALKDLVPEDFRVGLEPSLSLAAAQVMPGKHTVVDLVDEARLVKTPYEIGRIVYTSNVLDEGWAEAVKAMKPGVGARSLIGTAGRYMMGRITRDMPHLNALVSRLNLTLWAGKLSAQPHAVPGLHDVLKAGGPHVAILGGRADGYAAEMERTFFIGEVPSEAERPFEVMMEARMLAFDKIRPGVRAADVDAAVLDRIRKRGYQDHILHRTGHGLGVTSHEPPWIAVGGDHVLEEGMVVSVEPGIYLPGLGGFRHSDTVLVTGKGCEALTQSPDLLDDLVY